MNSYFIYVSLFPSQINVNFKPELKKIKEKICYTGEIWKS